MKNNDIGFLFKINNVRNTVRKADIYLAPGSKEIARRRASRGASLLHPARGWEMWGGMGRTIRVEAKKCHHYCCLLPVGERQGSRGEQKKRFILAAGLDVCQNEGTQK